MNGVFRWLIRFVPLVFYRLGLVRLWVLLPLKFRRHIVRLVTDTGERRSLDRPSEAGPPYVICGLASSTTSFGWALRATDQYLRAQGTKPTLIDLSSHFWAGGREKENRQAGEGEDLTGKGTAILHVNPNQFSFLKSVVQRDLLAKKYLVGYCFWELETRFVRDAFVRSGVSQPIRIVAPKLSVPEGMCSNRERFGLADDRIYILTALNLRSGLVRKNVLATIEAYKIAYGDTHDAPVLVLKLHDAERVPAAYEEIKKLIVDVPDIVVLTDDLDDHDMWTLIASCDVVLSLHRAEGYGLLMQQGMMLGKEVIATNWSGNTDFMAEENSHLVPYELVPVCDPNGIYGEMSDCHWAEVDPIVAAEILRNVCDELSSF